MSTRAPAAGAPSIQSELSAPALQRRADPETACPHCADDGQLHLSPSAAGSGMYDSPLPSVVSDVLSSEGEPLDTDTLSFFEPRFEHDFGKVRVHSDARAADSAKSLGARAWTTGRDVVFAAGEYRPSTPQGKRLLAHELTHVVQQGSGTPGAPQGVSRPSDPSEREADQVADQVMQAPAASQGATADSASAARSSSGSGEGGSMLHRAVDEAEPAAPAESETAAAGAGQAGFEIDPGQLMLMPQWREIQAPTGAAAIHRQAAPAAGHCDTPTSMQKVISGKFQGGKSMDDYFPDLVGAGFWGSKDTAGTFDTGKRAGSSVQLIGHLPIPCATSTLPTTLGQTATIVRARANGAKMMEGGKALEGQTINDIARSGRDQSRAPFRQTWTGAVSMADPISGIPYNTLTSYEWEVNLTTSLTGAGGTVSVGWGVTVEAAAGKVTKNEVR